MDLPSLTQALRSSQAFVHTLLDSIHIGICQVNPQGHILSLNLEGARILQRTEQSCLGHSFHEQAGCFHSDPITEEKDCPISQVLKSGKAIWTPKLLLRRPSGETRWVEYQCTQLTDPYNPGALILFRDLSHQLQQHEEHQHLASMPEESPNPIVEVDPQGRLIYANPAMIALLDAYRFREDGVPHVLPPALAHVARECLKSMSPLKRLTVAIDHQHFDWTFSPIQEKGLVRGYGIDITNHVRVRHSLTELQSQYSSFVDSAHEEMIAADLHGTIDSWNSAAEAIFGFEQDEIIGQSILMLLAEGYRDIYQKGLKEMSDGEPEAHSIQQPLELTGLRKTGESFPLEISLTSWKVGSDTQYGFTLRDISDRKDIEHALVAEKDRLVTTLQSLEEGIITTDREGRITFFNPLAEQITEWSHQEAFTRPFQEIFRLMNEASEEEDVAALQFSPTPSALTDPNTPMQLITKHGLQRTIAMRETPIRDHSGHLMGTVIMFHDTIDRQRQEDEQQRISKLNSLGVLAGGLAHDFNNLLTTILGNVFVVKLRMIAQDPLAQNLEQAEHACLRAKELTQQLLTFAKGGAPIKTSVVLGDLLRKSAIFALSGSSISCHFDIPNDLSPLDADASQLRQVIQNITINARQAMPQSGHFSIHVENTTLHTRPSLPTISLPPGDYIKIAFIDQGMGIAEQELPNIFDPYFTTKPGASGLGLAAAHSIIQQHHGHISVHSEKGKGSTFTVYLPSSYSIVNIDPQDIPKGRGRILVMDDEQSICRMVEDALTQFGYEVTTTRDGQTAIDVFSEALTSGDKFDALLLDLTVPGGMGGKEAIQHLRKLDPHLKALVTSGYSDDPILADFQTYGFQGILVKPYKIIDLAKTLESLCISPDSTTIQSTGGSSA